MGEVNGEGRGTAGLRARSPWRRVAWGLTAWALLGVALVAQPSPLLQNLSELWRWRTHVRATDGIPHRFLCVRDDGRGGLILADETGLWRFDGSRWRSVCAVEGLVDAQPMDILPLGSGWLMPCRSQLLLVQPDAGETQRARLLTEEVLLGRVCAGPDGRLVYGTLSGMYEVTPDGARLLTPGPGAAVDPVGYGLGLDGEPWCLGRGGVFRLVDGSWEPMPVEGDVRGGGDMAALLHDGERVLVLPRVFSARQRGLVWDGATLRPLQGPDMQGEFVDAATTPGGEVLVALRHNTLGVLVGETWRLPALPPGYDRSLKSVTATTEGRLAAVTYTGELVVHDRASTRWQAFDPRPFGVSAIVNTLAPARGGGLWLGTHRGVIRFVDGRFTDPILTAPVDGADPVELIGITAVAEDDDGVLWVGSGQNIEGVLARRDGRWERHVPPGMERRGVHALRRDRDGHPWMTLLSQDPMQPERDHGGVVTWDGAGFARPGGGVHTGGTPLSRAYDLTWTPDGDVLGAFLAGPARLTPTGWELLEAPAFRDGGKIFSLFSTRDGTLWCGHDLWKPGVAVQTRESPSWQVLDRADWGGAGAACFAEDEHGNLWFASEAGLFRYADGMCHRVRTAGVVSDNSFWALEFDDTGDLWLASMGSGLVRLETDDDRQPPRSDHVTSHPSGSGRALDVSWQLADTWQTSPSEQLRWQFRIDAGDWQPWSEPGRAPHVTLTDLSAGEHTVTVRAMDGWGNVEPEPVTATVVMPRALMQQPAMQLAVSLGLISIVGLGAMLLRRRKELAHEARQRLELNDRLRELTARMMHAEEQERRRLARDLHDDLGQLLTVISMNLEQALDNPDEDDRERALTRALSSTTRAVDSVRGLARRVRHTALDDLGLEAAVRTTLAEFAQTPGLRIEHELRFTREWIPDPPVSHIYRILQESLTNVVRHADASHVFVGLSVGERTVDLVVQDDGKGLDAEPDGSRRGLGLLGMRERAEAVDGRFSIESHPGHGTVVQVHIPLPPMDGP